MMGVASKSSSTAWSAPPTPLSPGSRSIASVTVAVISRRKPPANVVDITSVAWMRMLLKNPVIGP